VALHLVTNKNIGANMQIQCVYTKAKRKK